MSPSYKVGSNCDFILALNAQDAVITASKSTTTITKTTGRDFSPSDVGLTITWGAPASTTDTITAYISPTQVTVSASATIASQTATVGIETTMGLRLARDSNKVPQWRSYDDAPRLLVAQVQEAGFKIDPTTLEITFEKSAWDGPFGAYTEKQGSNRPAFGINIDFKRKTPILAPKRYTAAGVRFPVTSGTTSIVFNAGAKTIAATGIGTNLMVGDKITCAAPATGNNLNEKTITVVGADSITVAETIDTETVTTSLQMNFSSQIQSGVEFGGYAYICDEDKVYKMVSPTNAWDTTPGTAYFRTVFNYHGSQSNHAITAEVNAGVVTKTAGDAFVGTSAYISPEVGATLVYSDATYTIRQWDTTTQVQTNSASDAHASGSATVTYNTTLVQLSVHNGYIYVMAGSSLYAYSADGTTWTKSSRTNDNAGALGTRLLVGPKGILHKMCQPNTHYQMSVATDEAINGGTAWTGPDVLGDSAHNIQEMLSLQNNVVFCREDGVLNMDGGGNITDLFPELKKFFYTSNGLQSEVWNANSLFYIMAQGDVYMLQTGGRVQITPNLQIERTMEQLSSEANAFSSRIYGLTGLPQYLFAVMQASNAKILMLEDVPGAGMYWRTFLDYTSTNNGILWSTVTSTSGPVLWAQMSSPYKPSYWILPLASDTLSDSRSRYETPGYIYEPWMDLGCPDCEKIWSRVEVIAKGTSATLATITLNGYNAAGTSILSKTPTIDTSPTYSDNAFTADTSGNYISKRCRLLWTFANTSASHTPELLFYRVRARALPTPKRVFECVADVPQMAVTQGAVSQEQARSFLAAVRSSRRPITLTDPYGTAWTVIPSIDHPQEALGGMTNNRFNEGFNLRFVELTSGQ